MFAKKRGPTRDPLKLLILLYFFIVVKIILGYHFDRVDDRASPDSIIPWLRPERTPDMVSTIGLNKLSRYINHLRPY